MIMVEYDRSLSHRSSYYPGPPPRESSHFQHLDPHHSAPSTPSPPYQYAPLSSHSQQQQSNSVRSTPKSYPSPASYPSPSMSAYSYASRQGGHGSNSPQYQPQPAALNLPPMRITPPNAALPSPIVAPPAAPSQLPPSNHIYYQQNHSLPASSIPHAHITSSPMHESLRYPLPQPPERIMSGGRHKKEIKRRTKTGCLTCRKRRIKCDEAHPSCKNCAKSKRECMGYDPIFKSTPGPAAIQPAPSSGNPVPPSLTSAPISYGISSPSGVGMGYAPAVSTAGNSPASSCEPYEYSAIDPSLETTSLSPHSSHMGIVHDASVPYRGLKRAFDRTSPFPVSDPPRSSTTPLGRTMTPTQLSQRDTPGPNPAKRIKIDDLLSGGQPPLTPPAADQRPVCSSENIRTVYREKLAPKLDALTETRFFQTRGVQRIHRGGPFCQQLTALLTRLQARGGVYVEEEDRSLENVSGDAGVLLEAMRLVYGTQASTVDARSLGRHEESDYAEPSDIAQRKETLKRIRALEALVSGSYLSTDSASPTTSCRSSPLEFVDHTAQRSNFWKSLAKFVSLREGRDENREFEVALEDMKRNHGSVLVREVLHAIAEARYCKFRLSCGPKETSTSQERQRVEEIFESAKSVVLGAARPDGGSDLECFIQRIAGRAVGLWAPPITDAPLIL